MDLLGPENLMLTRIQGRAGGPKRELVFSVPRPPAPTPVPAPASRPSGNDPLASTVPITLVTREIGLRDALRQLAGAMNMNLVTDPSVKDETISGLSFRGMPLGQAFAYLFRMYGLSYAVTGKTILVGTPEALTRLLGKETTRSYRIAYADPKVLPGLLAGFMSFSRPPLVDERQRVIYLTGSSEQLRQAEQLLERLDAPGRQVMLEARIVEVADDASDQFSATIQGVYDHWWLSLTGGQINAGYTKINQTDVFSDNESSASSSITDVNAQDIAEKSGLKMLDAGINALIATEKAKLLASPSVIVLDGQKATIKLVDQTKYISAYDQAGNPTYGDIEAGPQLFFTPTIGRDNTVTIELNMETGSLEWKSGKSNYGTIYYPEKNSRSVATKITIRDGEPFVVGGLYKSEKTKVVNRVPILSDIPLLGELFKSKSNVDNTAEVVMIVVPRILTMNGSAPESGAVFRDGELPSAVPAAGTAPVPAGTVPAGPAGTPVPAAPVPQGQGRMSPAPGHVSPVVPPTTGTGASSAP
jgi:type IV pilus assembly protein PilQ